MQALGEISTRIPLPSREVDNRYSTSGVESQPIKPVETKNSITAIKKSMFEVDLFSQLS